MSMDNKKVEEYKQDIRDIPLWIKYVVASATIFGALFGGWGIYILLNQPASTSIIVNNSIAENATTTINIAELFSKALALDTILERQNFLTKYIGDQIYGDGKVEEISKYGNKFLIDVKVDRYTVSCPQNGGEEQERQLLLLKGKKVRLSGVFTYQQYFEHDGLIIDNCTIQVI